MKYIMAREVATSNKEENFPQCSLCRVKRPSMYITIDNKLVCYKCKEEDTEAEFISKERIDFNNGSKIELVKSDNVTRGKQSENIQWINDKEEPPRITIKAGTSGTPLLTPEKVKMSSAYGKFGNRN